MRWPLVFAVSLAAVMASCAVDIGDVRVGPLPTCDGATPELLLLMAQAVSSADQIPCLDTMPEGWELERADVETGRVELKFDGPGVDVLVVLTSACPDDADPAALDADGALRSSGNPEGGQAQTRLGFGGGCVVVDAPQRPAATEMVDALSFISRDELRALRDMEL